MTSRLSRNFSRCKAKALSTIQLKLKMRHDLTLQQTDSGVHDLAALSLMLELSTPMPKHRENYIKTNKKISRNAEELQYQ